MIKPYYEVDLSRIYHGHVLEILNTLGSGSVQCVITSPPYWGLRDYNLEPQIWDDPGDCEHEWQKTLQPGGNGTGESFRRDRRIGRKRGGQQPGFCLKCNAWKGSLGLEPNPELYIQHIVDIFREIKRVLRKDGTLWLNIGDTYATSAGKVRNHPGGGMQGARWKGYKGIHSQDPKKKIGPIIQPNRMPLKNFKPKDLCMIPARVAFALQADGWWLRSDIIWAKPNPMPESVKDRPTRAHEYIFLLSKSHKYYYDADAIKEPASPDTHARYARGRSNKHKYANGGPGNQTIAKTLSHMIKPGVNPKAKRSPSGWQDGIGSHDTIPKGRYPKSRQNESFSSAVKDIVDSRNKRSVWTIPTQPFSEFHFATFPENLVKLCILAGTSICDIILDPFGGSGTVGLVAEKLGRKWILIELSKEYCEMAKRRIEPETLQMNFLKSRE